MIDLNGINLESLPNVDNRLIPQLKRYFSRVMKLDGNPLDYRIETMYEELMNGHLEILVASKDKNSPDYYEDFPKYAIGLFLNKPTIEEKAEGKITKDVSRVFIDEHQLDVENIERFLGYEDATISHEMEHLISYRFDGQEHENNLCDYSIIGESATEIGNLYNLFDGDEGKIKDVILKEDDTVLHIGYLLRVRLLWAINEAAGHNIVELVSANRNNDFDYFCSIIPKKYIEKISLLYNDFFEGKCIPEIGEQPAKVLYDVIEQFKDYMYDNPKLYPNLTNQTIDMINSIFKGYEQITECRKEIGEQLGERCIYGIDYLEEEDFKNIISEIRAKFPQMSDEDIEYDIFAELLRQNPYDKKANVVMSCYSGYFKFLKSIEKVKENIGQEDFFVSNNFENFLDEYMYRDGVPTRWRYIGLKQEAIYREPKTGKVKYFINSNEVLEDEHFPIILDENDDYKYVPLQTILDKMKCFKEALRYYSFDKIEELSDEARVFLIPFYDDEEILSEKEYELDEERNVADIARNALMPKLSELNFASYTSVNRADEEFKKRTELAKDEGERI